MDKVKSVLFVCTGNSCRSPMAEGLLKKYLSQLGKGSIEVSSAGMGALDGFTPTDETIEVMKKEDVDLSAFKSRRLTEELIKAADLILVMEIKHKEYIKRVVPEAGQKTYLLKEFQKGGRSSYPEDPNVPDPIGKQFDYYKLSFEVIKDEIKRIVELL